jgi:FkbM family methyltransferase
MTWVTTAVESSMLSFGSRSKAMSSVTAVLGRAQRALGRSRLGTRIAIKIRNQCNMIIGAHLADSNLLSRSGEDWLAQLVAPSARYFVDVGANVGEWASMFAGYMKTPPAGILFEPNPTTAAHLRSVLRRKNLEGCQIVEAAVSDRDGSAQFYAEEACGETSSLYSSAVHTTANSVDVKVCRLDTELATRNVTQVDVLKIDAEGHDFFVMLGAISYMAAHRISMLQFEYNLPWIDAGATLTRAFDFLKSNGYKVRLLRRSSLYELDVRTTGEFFMYSNFIAYCPSLLGDILDRLPCRSAL